MFNDFFPFKVSTLANDCYYFIQPSLLKSPKSVKPRLILPENNIFPPKKVYTSPGYKDL